MNLSRTAGSTIFLLCLIVLAPAFRTAAMPTVQGPLIVAIPDVAGLHNILAIGRTVLSGSQPEGREAFRTLKEMGVTVVVSVDGNVPDVPAARQAGLRYVHVPIGYDGIRRTEQLALGRVIAENSTGRVYFHCHHGRHRGPAAAAVACRMNSLLDQTSALQLLKLATTADEYVGLWNVVRNARPADAHETIPVLHESVEPPDVVTMMKKLEQQFEVTTLAAGKLQAQDADFRQSNALLIQLYRETARLPDASGITAGLIEAAEAVEQNSGPGTDQASVARWLKEMEQRCVSCHAHHRD